MKQGYRCLCNVHCSVLINGNLVWKYQSDWSDKELLQLAVGYDKYSGLTAGRHSIETGELWCTVGLI